MSFPIQLALKAFYQHAFQNIFCAFGLAAVLTPLIVLFGLKTGVIDGLVSRLQNDPSVLQVTVLEHTPLTVSDINEFKAMREVGFVVGSFRSTALRAEIRGDEADLEFINLDLLPSDDNDPLLRDSGISLGNDEVAITETIANGLGKVKGDSAVISVSRNGGEEYHEVTITIAEIFKRSALSGERALIHKSLASNLSAFLDDYALPGNAFGGKPLEERSSPFDSVRIYASSLDMVGPLAEIVEARGFKTSSEASKIAWIQNLEATMNGIFAVVSIAGLIGYSVSLWAAIANYILEKRAELSLLRLIGVEGIKLWAFPLVQAFCITAGGLFISVTMAYTAGAFFNNYYLTDIFNGNICVILPSHILFSSLLSFGVAGVAAAQQMYAMKFISPTEALSDVL